MLDHGELHVPADRFGVDRAHIGLFVKTVSGDRLGNHRDDLAHVLIIDAQHRATVEWQSLREFDEGLFQLRKIVAIGFHVVGIDIGDDLDHRIQIQERCVRFVRFGHDEVAGAQLGIGAGTVQPAADHKGRIEAALCQDTGYQAGGGGLAMGAGNRDAALESHQFGQHQCPRHDRDVSFPSGNDFRIVLIDCGRGHDRIGPANIFRRVPERHFRAQAGEALRCGIRSEIGAGHRVAEVDQHFGNAAHAAAADSDEMDILDLVFHALSSLAARHVPCW